MNLLECEKIEMRQAKINVRDIQANEDVILNAKDIYNIGYIYKIKIPKNYYKVEEIEVKNYIFRGDLTIRDIKALDNFIEKVKLIRLEPVTASIV